MATSPTTEAAKAYLESAVGEVSWDDAVIGDALAAEQRSQARRCRVPVVTDDDPEPEWDDDLLEALYRRVATNLANRSLPLGVQASFAEAGVATNRVGGLDREVRRLEAPFRKTPKG